MLLDLHGSFLLELFDSKDADPKTFAYMQVKSLNWEFHLRQVQLLALQSS